MLAGHARAVVSAWSGIAENGGLLRPIVLVVATLFFALKFADVAWLRFRTDVRSIAALTLIVALLHLNTVGITGGELIPQILATASAVLFLDPVQRRWEQVLDRVALLLQRDTSNRCVNPKLRFLELLADFVQRSPLWRMTHASSPTRAPPV